MPSIYTEQYRQIYGQMAELRDDIYVRWVKCGTTPLVLKKTGGAFVFQDGDDIKLVLDNTPLTANFLGWGNRPLDKENYAKPDELACIDDIRAVFQLPYVGATEKEAEAAVAELHIGEKIGVRVADNIQKADKSAATKFLEVVDIDQPGRGYVRVRLAV